MITTYYKKYAEVMALIDSNNQTKIFPNAYEIVHHILKSYELPNKHIKNNGDFRSFIRESLETLRLIQQIEIKEQQQRQLQAARFGMPHSSVIEVSNEEDELSRGRDHEKENVEEFRQPKADKTRSAIEAKTDSSQTTSLMVPHSRTVSTGAGISDQSDFSVDDTEGAQAQLKEKNAVEESHVYQLKESAAAETALSSSTWHHTYNLRHRGVKEIAEDEEDSIPRSPTSREYPHAEDPVDDCPSPIQLPCCEPQSYKSSELNMDTPSEMNSGLNTSDPNKNVPLIRPNTVNKRHCSHCNELDIRSSRSTKHFPEEILHRIKTSVLSEAIKHIASSNLSTFPVTDQYKNAFSDEVEKTCETNCWTLDDGLFTDAKTSVDCELLEMFSSLKSIQSTLKQRVEFAVMSVNLLGNRNDLKNYDSFKDDFEGILLRKQPHIHFSMLKQNFRLAAQIMMENAWVACNKIMEEVLAYRNTILNKTRVRSFSTEAELNDFLISLKHEHLERLKEEPVVFPLLQAGLVNLRCQFITLYRHHHANRNQSKAKEDDWKLDADHSITAKKFIKVIHNIVESSLVQTSKTEVNLASAVDKHFGNISLTADCGVSIGKLKLSNNRKVIGLKMDLEDVAKIVSQVVVTGNAYEISRADRQFAYSEPEPCQIQSKYKSDIEETVLLEMLELNNIRTHDAIGKFNIFQITEEVVRECHIKSTKQFWGEIGNIQLKEQFEISPSMESLTEDILQKQLGLHLSELKKMHSKLTDEIQNLNQNTKESLIEFVQIFFKHERYIETAADDAYNDLIIRCVSCHFFQTDSCKHDFSEALKTNTTFLLNALRNVQSALRSYQTSMNLRLQDIFSNSDSIPSTEDFENVHSICKDISLNGIQEFQDHEVVFASLLKGTVELQNRFQESFEIVKEIVQACQYFYSRVMKETVPSQMLLMPSELEKIHEKVSQVAITSVISDIQIEEGWVNPEIYFPTRIIQLEITKEFQSFKAYNDQRIMQINQKFTKWMNDQKKLFCIRMEEICKDAPTGIPEIEFEAKRDKLLDEICNDFVDHLKSLYLGNTFAGHREPLWSNIRGNWEYFRLHNKEKCGNPNPSSFTLKSATTNNPVTKQVHFFTSFNYFIEPFLPYKYILM
jgi:hypothetical protein